MTAPDPLPIVVPAIPNRPQGVEQIAAAVDMPERDVELILHPEPSQHDFTDFLDEDGQRLYRRAVDESIANQLRWAYFRAQSFSETAYYPHTLPILKAMEQRHRRQCERLKGAESSLMAMFEATARTADERHTWPTAILCCVMDDMRTALGVEIKPPCMLLIRFAGWRLEVDKLEAVA